MTAVLPPVVVGLVLGLMGHWVAPAGPAHGLMLSTLFAVAGALLASYLGASLGWYAPGEWGDWLASWVGAAGLLAVARHTQARP